MRYANDSVPLQCCWAVNHSTSYSREHTCCKLETLEIFLKKKGSTWYKMVKKIMLLKAKWQQEQQQQLELLDKAPAL